MCEYIKQHQTDLSEMFSEYFSSYWKNFKNQEQNRINDFSRTGNESPTKFLSPKSSLSLTSSNSSSSNSSSYSNVSTSKEMNNLQFKILERLKMIQDRTLISAKRLFLNKMETSKILEIEWSKLTYNLYREKAIWEKTSDEIIYWKLGKIKYKFNYIYINKYIYS